MHFLFGDLERLLVEGGATFGRQAAPIALAAAEGMAAAPLGRDRRIAGARLIRSADPAAWKKGLKRFRRQ
jgi:hypothetical protein